MSLLDGRVFGPLCLPEFNLGAATIVGEVILPHSASPNRVGPSNGVEATGMLCRNTIVRASRRRS